VADELRIGLSELLRKAIMEMEVEEHVGARRHERSPTRTGERNG
jgi:transposase-like protein